MRWGVRALLCVPLIVGVSSFGAPAAHADPPETAPIFECAFKTPGGSGYTTAWGYDNQTGAVETHAIGDHNRFLPRPYDVGQPLVFAKGRHDNVLTVPWDGHVELKWKLGLTTVRAQTTPVCDSNSVPITGSGLGAVFAVLLFVAAGVALDRWLRRRRARMPTP